MSTHLSVPIQNDRSLTMISGESRKIQLRGGGSLSVRLEGVSWMHFGEEERTLLSVIADALHDYEQKRGAESPAGARDTNSVTLPLP